MTFPSHSTMRGKQVLITGGTDGIGKATAIHCARRGATVVVVGRSRAKAEAALTEIKQRSGNQAIHFLIADLGDHAAIRRLAEAYTSQFGQLNVLINNAGLFTQKPTLSADGFEIHFAVMYLGHFLLTNLLLNSLRSAAPARIINVSAWGHHFGKLDFDSLRGEKPITPFAAYCQAKLAQVLFTKALAKRLEATCITAYSLHPGVIYTNLGAEELPSFARPLAHALLPNPEQGASTSTYLATAPDIERYNGHYFSYRSLLRSHSTRPARVSRLAQDETLAAKLWNVSAALCREPSISFAPTAAAGVNP